MRCRLSTAVAGAVLAALAAPTSARKGCNGKFECSTFIFDRFDTSRIPTGSVSRACTYGHIEVNGKCDKPCNGVRAAPCRCKTKQEAEDRVVETARTSLYISLAIFFLGCVCAGFALKQLLALRQARKYMREQAQVSSPPPQQPPPHFVQATVVGTSAPEGNENNNTEAQAVAQAQPIRQGSSRLELVTNRNPGKAMGVYGLLFAVTPCVGIGFWIWRAAEAPSGGITNDFGLFLGLVAIIAYAVLLLSMAARVAMNRSLSVDRSNPFLLFMVVYRRMVLAVPIVGIAGIIWAIHRMINPSDKYSTC